MKLSPSINGDKIALKIIVTHAVEAIRRMLPRVRATKIAKFI